MHRGAVDPGALPGPDDRGRGGRVVQQVPAQLGVPAPEASRRLFIRGEVAATPMAGWGPSGGRYLRLVFANEPAERLSDLRDRFGAAFASAATLR